MPCGGWGFETKRTSSERSAYKHPDPAAPCPMQDGFPLFHGFVSKRTDDAEQRHSSEGQNSLDRILSRRGTAVTGSAAWLAIYLDSNSQSTSDSIGDFHSPILWPIIMVVRLI